jgi:ribosome-binding factor A
MAARKPRSDAGPSQRMLRVAEEIRHTLAMVFERADFRDPALMDRRLTVTEVRMSPDLRHATVWVVPFGLAPDATLTKALNHAAPWLSGQVAKAVRTKFAPKLSFRHDPVPDEAARIDRLLHQAEVVRDVTRDGAGDGDKDADEP